MCHPLISPPLLLADFLLMVSRRRRAPPGRPILERASHKTIANRLSLLRRVVACHCPPGCSCVRGAYKVKYGCDAPYTRQRHQISTNPDVRKRAPVATHALVIQAMMLKATGLSWSKLRLIKGPGGGVYKDRVIALQKVVASDIPFRLSTRGAFLDATTVLPMVVDLAERDGLSHEGAHTPQINVFCDATNYDAYDGQKCHVLAVGLPHTKQPHSRGMTVTIGRWIGAEKGYCFAAAFLLCGLIAALSLALATPIRGLLPRLVCAPDWAFLVVLLGANPVGHAYACVDCNSRKGQWEYAGYPRGRPLDLEHYRNSDCWSLLSLFKSILYLVYDPLHCVALVLRHMVFHAFWLWLEQRPQFSAALSELRHVLATNVKSWRKPEQMGPGHQEFSLSGKIAKDVLANDALWVSRERVMPSVTVECVALQNGERVPDAFGKYLTLVRQLCRQLLSWAPEGVDRRDEDCDRMHALYTALDLPAQRVTVNCHYFLTHYTQRLRLHGNLVGMCSEGGEHLHGWHKEIVMHHSDYTLYVCPPGLMEVMRSTSVWLWVWKHGYCIPSSAFQAHRRPMLAPLD